MELDKAGNFFWMHSMAMTAEGLHSKSAIAMELGHRDMVIAQLEQQRNDLQAKFDSLAAAAQAVIDRWDTPLMIIREPAENVMEALRNEITKAQAVQL
jgi:hypothetical protein